MGSSTGKATTQQPHEGDVMQNSAPATSPVIDVPPIEEWVFVQGEYVAGVDPGMGAILICGSDSAGSEGGYFTSGTA